MRSFVIWNLKPWSSWNEVLRDTYAMNPIRTNASVIIPCGRETP